MKQRLPSSLRGDLIAGATTAVMLVPQAMAYALLAGLPPIVGLYAASVPLVVYAIAGTSRQLAVGPVAMDSLLTAATVGTLAAAGTEHYAELAALLAILAGGVQLVMGAFRGGFVVNFLSRPVVSGFTSAAAVIIGASQLRLLLGVDVESSTSVFKVAGSLASSLGEIHVLTALVSMTAIAALLSMKRWAPRLPRAVIVVVVAGVVTWLGHLDDAGIAIVGAVPGGFPRPSLPDFDLTTVQSLATGAVTIAFVAFMESISVATKLAESTNDRVNPNRELVALGLANVASGVVRGYPVAGGFARSAVNVESGAQTKLAGVITAALVAITLAWFGGALYYVPTPVLGSIIVMAVIGLIDIAEPRRLWVVKRTDFAMLLATFAATLVLGIQQGILSGVGLSLLVLVVRTTRPHIAILGQLPGTNIYRNINRFPDARPIDGVVILRLDAQLYFGNVTFLRDTLARVLDDAPVPPKTIILDMSAVNQLDSSAEKALANAYASLCERGIRLIMSGAIGPVRDVLSRSGLLERLGPHGLALSVHEAAEAAQRGTPPPNAQHSEQAWPRS